MRDLKITVSAIEVRVKITESTRGHVAKIEAALELTEEMLKELSGDLQERLHGDVMRWLCRSFEDVRAKHRLLFGGGGFSKKEVNKIGKIVFRLPAACHAMLNRYKLEKGKETQIQVPSISSNEESAIEDSEDEELRRLVGGAGERQQAERRHTVVLNRARTAAQQEKAAFVQDEMALRVHATTCDACDCKWIDELDGHPDVYPHKVVNHGKVRELVLEKCGKSIDVSCAENCTLDDTRGHK